MKLFLISQTENDNYDTFTSSVVCAPDENAARGITPYINDENGVMHKNWKDRCWCSNAKYVNVTYLGEARDGMPVGAVCSSFNAAWTL